MHETAFLTCLAKLLFGELFRVVVAPTVKNVKTTRQIQTRFATTQRFVTSEPALSSSSLPLSTFLNVFGTSTRTNSFPHKESRWKCGNHPEPIAGSGSSRPSSRPNSPNRHVSTFQGSYFREERGRRASGNGHLTNSNRTRATSSTRRKATTNSKRRKRNNRKTAQRDSTLCDPSVSCANRPRNFCHQGRVGSLARGRMPRQKLNNIAERGSTKCAIDRPARIPRHVKLDGPRSLGHLGTRGCEHHKEHVCVNTLDSQRTVHPSPLPN